MSCETDEECKKYIKGINDTITEIWTQTENDIARIDLEDEQNVGTVVNSLLEKKQRMDRIRNGLHSRNRELQTIQERLDGVTKDSKTQNENNQKVLKEMEENNEKVIHYAQLLQSADGRQREVPKNYQITLSNFLPFTLPFAKKVVLMTIPKDNTVSYLIVLLVALITTLCFLLYTVYKIIKPMLQSGTISVDSNVADQLAEINKDNDTPPDQSPDQKPDQKLEQKQETPADQEQEKRDEPPQLEAPPKPE